MKPWTVANPEAQNVSNFSAALEEPKGRKDEEIELDVCDAGITKTSRCVLCDVHWLQNERPTAVLISAIVFRINLSPMILDFVIKLSTCIDYSLATSQFIGYPIRLQTNPISLIPSITPGSTHSSILLLIPL